MERNRKGFNLYFFFVLIILLALIWINSIGRSAEEYSRKELVEALNAGDVAMVIINPNQQAPTGKAEITLKTGEEKTLYATDISQGKLVL